jgi:hypothetical protein
MLEEIHSYKDVLSKDAELLKNAAAKTKVLEHLPLLGGALAWSALMGAGGYFLAKRRHEEHEKQLKNSFNALTTTDAFKKNPGQYQQRFTELTMLSPTVAMNPNMANKVIKDNLENGFNLDDVHRLSAVEYYTSKSDKPAHPHSVAARSAWSGLSSALSNLALPNLSAFFGASRASKATETAVNKVLKDQKSEPQIPLQQAIREMTKEKILGAIPTQAPVMSTSAEPSAPTYTDEMKRVDEMIKAMQMAGKKSGGQVKQSSEIQLRVSDECMGRMLADRYCLYSISEGALSKTAATSGFTNTLKSYLSVGGKAIDKHLKSYLSGGGKAIDKYLKVMLLPIAIGGGIQLIKSIQKSRDNAAAGEAADKVFARLRAQSDLVKESPELAMQAFDSLKSFAPALAAKPIITKTFVEDVIKKQGLLPPDTINMLSKTEQMIQQVKDTTGGQGFIEGLKSPMSLFGHSIKGSLKD